MNRVILPYPAPSTGIAQHGLRDAKPDGAAAGSAFRIAGGCAPCDTLHGVVRSQKNGESMLLMPFEYGSRTSGWACRHRHRQ